MKRIIACPKCETKLAVLDIGKPLNQKCPKCGHAFIIDSEKVDNKVLSDAPAKTPENLEQAKSAGTSIEPLTTTTPAPSKTIAKPAELDLAPKADAISSLPEPVPHAGTSKIVLLLLIIICVIQLVTFKKNMAQHKKLIEHLQYIEENMTRK